MLAHKRSKAAFEAMKGWSLYSYVLFMEEIRPQESFRRVCDALARAVRLAADRDGSAISKRLQYSCDSALRKRNRDQLEGEIPTWVKPGAWVQTDAYIAIPGSNYCYDHFEIVDVCRERRVVSIQRAPRHAGSQTIPEISIDRIWKDAPYHGFLGSGYTRVQVIAGDFQNLEGTVLDVYRNRIYFRCSQGRILKAHPRQLVSMGVERPYIDIMPADRWASFPLIYLPPLGVSS